MSTKTALKRFLTAFVAVVLLATACAPAALAAVKATVNTSTKVYSIPSSSAKSISVPKGLMVTISSVSGNWAKIKYKGYSAYIDVSQLNLVNRIVAYTAKSTPVYRQASSSSSQLGTLSVATAVYVVGKSGKYYRVQNKSKSVTGYVESGYLVSKAPSTGSTGGSTASGKLLTLLKSLLGRPYASSANPPKSFNCSTFVKYVMGKFGISMKGTASAQAADSRYSKITSLSSLKVGDILCFDTTGNGTVDHTAIYVGGKYFVEASKNAGKVQVNTFDTWYKSRFKWARRPSK